MLEMVTLALDEVFYYIQRIIYYFTYNGGIWSWFSPILYIGIAISVIFVVIKLIKATVWGS